MVRERVAAEVAFVTNLLAVARGGYTSAEFVGFGLMILTGRKMMRHVEARSGSGAAAMEVVVLEDAHADQHPVAR